jgi:ABC-2 type transport system ATP-binding protein
MSEPIVRVEGLRFEYPGVRALDDVSFTLGAGTVTALVGPNGAGKSTLLRCMAGLETPVTGRIGIDGVDVLEAPRAAHRRLGYLSDFFGVYQALTVRQCLAHAAAIHQDADAARDVERTAARLGLGDRLETPAGSLSRGLRQRLAIGQAIIHAPRLLLLDEPAAGLDPEARAALAVLFRELQGSGMTLVVSSHILAELEEYSTHMLVLRAGRIVEQRAVGVAVAVAGATPSRRLRVRLAAPDSRLAARMNSAHGVSALESHDAEATFDFSGDLHAQATLVAGLVQEGFAVASLEEVRASLQDSYLRTVGEGPR